MTQAHWLSKSTFLGEVTGNEIVQAQELINNSDNQFVVATTILPIRTDSGDYIKDGDYIFNAWIYYKVDPTALQTKPIGKSLKSNTKGTSLVKK